MPVYILVGPAAALIGIVAIFFVMRNRSTQKKSMYSSRRGQIERKVQAARARTLAPRGRSQKPPTAAEIAAAAPVAPAYEAPASPARQAWEQPAAPPPPQYSPPPAPEYVAPAAAAPEAPAAPFAEPFAPAPAPDQPEWTTPAPSEPVWTPAPAPAPDFSAPAESPAPAAPVEPATPVSTPAGGGASWEIVGGAVPQAEPASEPRGKKAKDEKPQQQTGAAWSLSSGETPGAAGEEGDEEVKGPSAAMALAQYAVIVVGLAMVLIGVLVMVANAKVT